MSPPVCRQIGERVWYVSAILIVKVVTQPERVDRFCNVAGFVFVGTLLELGTLFLELRFCFYVCKSMVLD